MMNPPCVPRVFNIPSDVPFLPSLARAILAGGFPAPDGEPPGPLELSQWTVLLPTRRAAGALTAAFLEAGGGRALLLPRIRPLGDVDEDEFAFSPLDPEGMPFAVPPAIPETRQLFLLSRLIVDWLGDHATGELSRALIGNPAQVFGLA
ncbi:MAG: double-strand break repair protein AddB, partial [Pseudomonadota bacterium]|nr:double-strand break repair protein AddB [Pseudomonadota bacterium]